MDKFTVTLLAGKKQSGKDTVATRLVSEHKYAHTSFAGFLKELSLNILHNMECKITPEHFSDPELKEKFIVDIHGKQFMFKNRGKSEVKMTYRQFLQQFGTEAMRTHIHADIWVLPVLKFIRDAFNDPQKRYNGVVVSDCRFPNEIEEVKRYCKQFGDMMNVIDVEIVRPGLPKMDLHASEIALDDFSFYMGILNDGSLEDLYVKADQLATGEWRVGMMNKQVQKNHEKHWLRQYDKK